MAEEDHGSSGEYGRPRRPSPDTVSYINGLPLDEATAAQQAREYISYYQNKNNGGNEGDDYGDDDAPEYPQMLSATHAALSSIFHELGSLACEEIPSQQVETLVRIACRYSLVAKRIVLASMATYWTFLSTHRFGSHVAQTVLRCAVAECEVNLDDFDDGQGEKNEGKMVIEDSYESLLQNEDGSNSAAVPQSLSQILVQTLEEVKPYASELAEHICGSHVLRTVLCIAAGVEFAEAFPKPISANQINGMGGEWDTGVLAATRRGKFKDKKKKKKKRGAPTDDDGSGSPQVATVMKEMKLVDELRSDSLKKETDALFNDMVGILSFADGEEESGKVCSPGELQQRTCHPSAGPLIVQILRLLSYRDFHSQQLSKKKKDKVKEIVPDRRLGILPLEPRYSHGSQAESFAHRLLCWDPSIAGDTNGEDADSGEATKKQPYASDIIFGLSGEPRGSILLEAIFNCSPDSFHDALCKIGGFYDEETLREYIKHGVSNFVVQTILITVRNKEQVSRMVKCLCGIVEDGSILKVKVAQPTNTEGAGDSAVGFKPKSNNQRMGIIWRAIEMCASKGSSQDQEQILSALLRGFASVSTPSEKESISDEKSDDKKRKKRSKAKGLSVDGCIPHLLGLAPGSCEGEGEFAADGSRITLNATGAKALFHILHFKDRLRTDWVKGIVRIYGCEDLVKIANDGLGSRCIMDGLLDGPSRSAAAKLLFPKLSDRITSLANERVGHHTVEKLFRALPMEDKAALSAELSQSLSRLGSNAMGRSVMVSCAVKEYLEGESTWTDAVSKQQKDKENWLEEILGEKEGSDNEEVVETPDDTKKRKKDKKEKKAKKRKRRKGSE